MELSDNIPMPAALIKHSDGELYILTCQLRLAIPPGTSTKPPCLQQLCVQAKPPGDRQPKHFWRDVPFEVVEGLK